MIELYRIVNRATGRTYVGITGHGVELRIRRHVAMRSEVGQAIAQNGMDAFEITTTSFKTRLGAEIAEALAIRHARVSEAGCYNRHPGLTDERLDELRARARKMGLDPSRMDAPLWTPRQAVFL